MCPKCGGKQKALFSSLYCPKCDKTPTQAALALNYSTSYSAILLGQRLKAKSYRTFDDTFYKNLTWFEAEIQVPIGLGTAYVMLPLRKTGVSQAYLDEVMEMFA